MSKPDGFNEHNNEASTSSKMGSQSHNNEEKRLNTSNNIYQDLFKSLEGEQKKLEEFEIRREKLREEMMQLRVDIQEEKRLCSLAVEQNSFSNIEIRGYKSDLSSSESDNTAVIDDEDNGIKKSSTDLLEEKTINVEEPITSNSEL